MKIGSLSEDKDLEKRISITPEVAKKYIGLGLEVYLDLNYGSHLGFDDSQYKDIGVKVLADQNDIISNTDLLVQLNLLNDDKLSKIKENQTLIGVFNPYNNKEKIETLSKKKINIFSLELLPRITRAQSMDILSSQANLAGYKAVIESFANFKKAIPMMMTAAGTIPAAKVLVVGAGVAGLQAIATAKRLGAIVSAYDVRLAAKEEVESLGAKFIIFDEEALKKSQTTGGYAKEMGADYKKKQEQALEKAIPKNNIIICTALIPNKPAPLLILKKTLEKMQRGSVIVDLAVETGGNCELSEIDKIIDHNGVKIIGYANYPSRIPGDSSTLYSRNLFNFIKILINQETKKIKIDLKDEIIEKTLIAHQGKLMNL